MRCPQCQHQNRDGAKFCEECAATLARACANCGSQLSASAKFCSECAHPAASPPTRAQPRLAAPEAHIHRHLAEKILTSKSAVEGERKHVTVLFADLKGSMELLADRDPEEARRLLDPVLQHMMEAVHRTACVPVHIRVGLNSGEVVVRSIGSDLHMDYTAVGQTTHLAARMEQMAMPGTILMAPDTLRLAEDYVVVKPLGARPGKGLDRPVEVYEVIGASTVRSRVHAAVARGLTRFVGRDGELEQLRRALEQARGGQGQVVAIVGEAGVGKSRLYWEFIHSHRTEGWTIAESSSVSYGKATSYLPIVELPGAYSRIEPHDDVQRIREKVTGKLLSLDRALEPALPAILWLLDVPAEEPEWQRLPPPPRPPRGRRGGHG